MSSRVRKRQTLDENGLQGAVTNRKRPPLPGGPQDASGDSPETPRSYDGLDIDPGFASIRIEEILELDPRPTFVVDLEANFEVATQPVFVNCAFRTDLHLPKTFVANDLVTSLPHSPSFVLKTGFMSWVRAATSERPDTSCPSKFSYRGFLWSTFSVRKRWAIVSGVSNDHGITKVDQGSHLRNEVKRTCPDPRQTLHFHARTPSSDPAAPDFTTIATDFETLTSTGTPDWTVPEPKGELSPHVILARSIDWSQTPLGDMSTWSAEFRQVANLLMGNPHPAALFWGDELTVMYNKAYAEGVAGNKHPQLMGTGFRGPFSEIWEDVGPLFNKCQRTGLAVAMADQMLPIMRHGFIEETFFTWSITPLYGGTSKLLGLYNATFETTRQTISDRRTKTLLKLGEQVALAKSVSAFWRQVLMALDENEFDVPFALLYSVLDDFDGDEESSISSESSQAMKSCILEGSLGVPQGHPAAPPRLDLKRSSGGFISAFRDAMQTREPKLLTISDGTLSKSLIEGIEWRGFGEPSKLAVVCPIRPTTGENVIGFLLIGVNPRRPYDEDYQSFIRILNRQLATSLASVTLFEEEIRQGLTAAEAAAQERSRLSEELAFQTSRLQRIAEVSPVGMYSCSPTGLILEANDRWYGLTGLSRDEMYEMSWMEIIHDDSLETVKEGWRQLIVEEVPTSFEMQLKRPWRDPDSGEEYDSWMLAAAQPEFHPDGSLKWVMGSMTDITLQKRSAKDAETRAHLSEQLLLRTQEAKENEKNFKRFSDLAPGGLVILDFQGKIIYANSQWFNISGHPQGSVSDEAAPLSWTSAIFEHDQEFFAAKWDELITKHVSLTLEIRMQTPWVGEIGGSTLEIQRWILTSMFPEVSEDGTLVRVMGCITDISRIKWAEGLQNRRLKEAEETRRQQNNFIDITSHEMRNPLSAILQCADGISTSLGAYQSPAAKVDPELAALMKESIDAADTIQLCAQYQKSIVDDILTISKLDSNLLIITPVAIQPQSILNHALKMFVPECTAAGVQLDFHIEPSYHELHMETVMLDSSRLLQVLINLLTNAIKFTKSETRKAIGVSLGAYLEPPPPTTKDFQYFPTEKARSNVTAGEDWGIGEIIYLRFQVRDTGCGLSKEEKSKLFTRFSQASPRTHVQYGGSGLGLFISRQLTELQGGEIGVASEVGVGSTFAFYMKCRRAETQKSAAVAETRLNSEMEKTARLTTQTPSDILNHENSHAKILQRQDSLMVAPGSSSPTDWHILIVEDNLVNQRVLESQIKKLGSVVYVANHGGEALDLIKETKYFKGKERDGKELSVILMDLEMPIMNGLDCVKRIREWQNEGLIVRHLPVIAVTANARGEQIAAARDSGMDDVMPKPFRIRQLVPKIERLLQKAKR